MSHLSVFVGRISAFVVVNCTVFWDVLTGFIIFCYILWKVVFILNFSLLDYLSLLMLFVVENCLHIIEFFSILWKCLRLSTIFVLLSSFGLLRNINANLQLCYPCALYFFFFSVTCAVTSFLILYIVFMFHSL